jgi:hypothetical protein
MQQQSMAQCHVNETHAICFTSPQEIASQIMKAMKVPLFEKPSIVDHNGDTICIGLSTLDVPAISTAHAPPDLRLPAMQISMAGQARHVALFLTLRHDANTFEMSHQKPVTFTFTIVMLRYRCIISKVLILSHKTTKDVIKSWRVAFSLLFIDTDFNTFAIVLQNY